jgi:hypothetical protein
MQLEINGLEANVHNNWTSTDCLNCLRKYQSAWERLQWRAEKRVPMTDGLLWELYGGILAQTDNEGVFHFLKLASSIRDIEEHSWELKPDVENIRDFGMDPSQDLLVWITAPTRTSPSLSLHLRTLSKAEKHPLARHGIIRYDRCTPSGRWHFSIKIMKDYIGLCAYQRPAGDLDGSHDNTDFFIWNWKEDKLDLVSVAPKDYCHASAHVHFQDISTKYTQSFAFVSDSHVILADRSYSLALDRTEGYLTLIDFRAEGGSKKPLSDVQNSIKLCYPNIAADAAWLEFNIASEPTPSWTPGKDDQTPFFVARENRIFTASMIFASQSQDLAYDHFIPLSAFKKCLDRLESSKGQELKWSEWAPTETRLVRTGSPSSAVWVCFAHGSRSIAGGMRRRGQRIFFYTYVYNFNQLALRKDKAMNKEMPENCERVDESRCLSTNSIWAEVVETSLPYKRYSKRLDVPPAPYSLMCTADHLVLVDVSELFICPEYSR